MSARTGKSRSLSDEERTLWRDVTRNIDPLRVQLPAEETSVAQAAPAARVKISPPAKPAPAAKQVKSKSPPPTSAPLGRRLKLRVARGKEAIDGRLDLHGLTQSEAHGALLRFLHQAQARDARLVVVITGKGSRSRDSEGESGVLRRQVPMWLRLPEFSAMVIGFENAHRSHGGEGALYVRVRRVRG
jgi:DNA-nicking Smr family endonuclease